FFFFQAEDGIRDRTVTGVQTCALPISLIPAVARMELAGIKVDSAELKRLSTDFARRLIELEREIYQLAGHEFNIGSPKQLGDVRSEERRVGKERGARRTPEHGIEEQRR